MKTNDERVFSHILVCKNIEKAKESLQELYSKERYIFFEPEKDAFLLDDVKSVIKEAYIAEATHKFLILVAKSYKIESQNALLKIFEEPPRNIVFVVVATSKTALLPTIRSRLPVVELKGEKEFIHSGLELKKLDLGDVYPFILKHQKLDKTQLKSLIQAIITEAINEHKIRFTEGEMEFFEKLLHLAELNARAQVVLSSLLLCIMQRKYQ